MKKGMKKIVVFCSAVFVIFLFVFFFAPAIKTISAACVDFCDNDEIPIGPCTYPCTGGGTCTGVNCQKKSGNLLPDGSSCSQDWQCNSGTCRNGNCAPSGDGGGNNGGGGSCSQGGQWAYCENQGQSGCKLCNGSEYGVCATQDYPGHCSKPAAPPPTNTPTPARPALCQSATISKTTLDSGESLTITSTANTNQIKTFTYGFYNKDNLYPAPNGTPKPIYFITNTHYVIAQQVQNPTNTYTVTINFSDIDKSDLNWNSQKPRDIQVNAYFTNTQNQFSLPEVACVVSFTVSAAGPTATPTPTPTNVPGCSCSANLCADVCPVNQTANRFTDLTNVGYTTPMKCSLPAWINFSSAPTDTNKNAWCNDAARGKGGGNSKTIDYFYYVRAVLRAPLPPAVNVDFNGDGTIDGNDLLIWEHRP